MNQYICFNLGDFFVLNNQFKAVESYDTHDNNGRPFRVYISDNGIVGVFYLEYQEETSESVETALILEANPEKIWVGESPQNQMTEFSGAYGPYFKGNSILLHISGKRYLFIGTCIFMFESRAPIVYFVSHVGNNDVPYPFAVDSQDYYYLLIENVICENRTDKKLDDPYEYYYHSRLITTDFGRIPPRQPINPLFQDILEWRMSNSRWTMTYVPNPVQNYDRHINNKLIGGESKMYVKKATNPEELIELSKEHYIKLMDDFGQEMGFIPLDFRMIHDRRW